MDNFDRVNRLIFPRPDTDSKGFTSLDRLVPEGYSPIERINSVTAVTNSSVDS
jgi:hypothetical protein